MDFINSNTEESYIIGSKYFNITPTELKNQLAGIRLMSRNDNNNALTYGNNINSLHGAINQAVKFLQEKGVIKETLDSIKIIDPSFIRELNK